MASEGIKQKRKENTSLILLDPAVEEEKSDSKERVSNLSLDFPAFGPSVLVGPRSKDVLRGKGYHGHLFWGVSTTSGGSSFLLLDLIHF